MDDIMVPVAQRRKRRGSVGILDVAEEQINSLVVPCGAGYVLCEGGQNRRGAGSILYWCIVVNSVVELCLVVYSSE